MRKNDPRTNNKILISGLVFLLLGSMLWEIVSAFLKGGSDAPSLAVLIVGILVLGGGMLFSAVLVYRGIRCYYQSAKEKEEEKTSEN